MKTIQIIFCVLACLCVAASVFVGIFCGWEWFFLVIACAAVFAGGMLWAKKKTEPPKKPAPDFMNSDEENERIKNENDEGEQTNPNGKNSEPPQEK